MSYTDLNERTIEIIKNKSSFTSRLDVATRALNHLAETGGWDEEIAHILADRILLAVINDPELEEAFNQIPKWYA